MYYPYFIAYIGIGLTISLVVFYWAFRTGQFNDQQRARFLPLRDDTDQPPLKPPDSIGSRYTGSFSWQRRAWAQRQQCWPMPCISVNSVRPEKKDFVREQGMRNLSP